MIRSAKQTPAAPIAGTQTAAVHGFTLQLVPGPGEQFGQILGRRRRGTTLELDGLAKPRQSANSYAARSGIGAEQVAHEEITAVKFLQVFIHHQADKEVTARLFLIFWS